EALVDGRAMRGASSRRAQPLLSRCNRGCCEAEGEIAPPPQELAQAQARTRLAPEGLEHLFGCHVMVGHDQPTSLPPPTVFDGTNLDRCRDPEPIGVPARPAHAAASMRTTRAQGGGLVPP